MNLQELVSRLPFAQYKNILNEEITGIESDSRKIQSNHLFVCIKGYTVDGHDYVNDAIENGAVAIISERPLTVSVPVIVVQSTSDALAILSNAFYDYPSEKMDLVGITGTNGKTTITYILEQIFQHHQSRTGVIGTIQMKIQDDVYPIRNTTPDALTLQQSLKKMVDEKIDISFIEVSSHALELGRVHGCDFDIAVFTNLSQDHLDFHQTMDDYLHAKSLLFSQLGNRYDRTKQKYAILNKDDSSFETLCKSTAQPIITYSCDVEADIYATDIDLQMEKSAFRIHTPKGYFDVTTHLVGRFNVYNILAAVAVAICKNIPLVVIKEAIEQLSGVAGRFESIRLGQSYSVIVDFAHTEDSLENVLKAVRDFSDKNIYVVVGCGGDRDKKKRPLMAKVATKYATHAFFTSDNPRNEDPKAILADMTSGLDSKNYTEIVSRKAAIEAAVAKASTGDVVLIAGKGHETEQIIGTKVYRFDDRVEAENAIRKKGIQ